MADIVKPTPERVWSANGDVEPGARLYFFVSGTSTIATVYSDAAGTIAHARPVIADASGVLPPIYSTAGASLRCVIRDADEVELEDIDPVATIAQTASGASNITFAATDDIAEDNVQDAIEAVDANWRAAKTGSDDGLVSGTAGANNTFAKWNSDGDLVQGPMLLDEDDFSSDSAVSPASQQSIKAYVDNLRNVVTDTYTATTAISAAIPVDTTRPQNTEGTEIMSAAITPRSATSKIRISVTVPNTYSTSSGLSWTVAVFRNSATAATYARLGVHLTNAGPGDGVYFSVIDEPASTSEQTYSVRVGPASGSIQLNYYHNDSAFSQLTLEEVDA